MDRYNPGKAGGSIFFAIDTRADRVLRGRDVQAVIGIGECGGQTNLYTYIRSYIKSCILYCYYLGGVSRSTVE